ncbi:hypothetical protein J6590_105035, partial [Homalodisca vitripennis]
GVRCKTLESQLEIAQVRMLSVTVALLAVSSTLYYIDSPPYSFSILTEDEWPREMNGGTARLTYELSLQELEDKLSPHVINDLDQVRESPYTT